MTVSWFVVGAFLCLPIACSGSAAGPGRAVSRPLEPQAAAALYARGVESAGREDFSRAEQYLAAALGRGYPESRVVPWLVRVCLASARLRTALRYAEPYLLRHPDDAALLHLVAAIRLSLGDAAGARTALEHVVELAPDHAQARYLLAVVLRDGFDEPDAAARELSAYLLVRPRGEHAAEARSFLREYATRHTLAPTASHGGGSGSRGSTPTNVTVPSRAAPR